MPEIETTATTQPSPPPTPDAKLISQPVKPNRPFLPIAAVLAVLLLTGLAFGSYQLGKSQVSVPEANTENDTTAPGTGSATISATVPNPSLIPVIPTDPAVNWKTYTNTKNGYSLKYPTVFEIVKGPIPESELPILDNISLSGMEKSSDSNAGVGINISVNPSDANGKPISCTTNDDCLQKLLSFLNKSSNEVTNITNTLMGKSVKGFEYQNKNSLYIQTNQYFIYPENGKIWQLSMNINNYSTQETLSIINQILSTFKFLDQTSEGAFCGGFAGIPCAEGYKCQLEGSYPDAGGTCVLN
ncbi:MAG: hypothetical protein AAB486_04925 [Patescibacteria group bacterium]